MHITWKHIAQFYYADVDSGLRLIPKITYEHINLTRYFCNECKISCLSAKFHNGKCPPRIWSSDAAETAKFCALMDQFFDCTNVPEHKRTCPQKETFPKTTYIYNIYQLTMNI